MQMQESVILNRSDYQLFRLEKLIKDRLYSGVGRAKARSKNI